MFPNGEFGEGKESKSVKDILETKDEQICNKKEVNEAKFNEVKKESNYPIKVIKQNERGKQYPRNCEDCRKYLRNNNDFRKHIEGCILAKYCK